MIADGAAMNIVGVKNHKIDRSGFLFGGNLQAKASEHAEEESEAEQNAQNCFAVVHIYSIPNTAASVQQSGSIFCLIKFAGEFGIQELEERIDGRFSTDSLPFDVELFSL